VIETGESRYGEGDTMAVPGLRKDGARISLEFTIVPIRTPDGRMEGMVAILRDVTRRFDELRALRRELAALKRDRPATPGQDADQDDARAGAAERCEPREAGSIGPSAGAAPGVVA
jgi:PAS domain-containing protein